MNYEQLKTLIIEKYGSLRNAATRIQISYPRLRYALNSKQGLRLKEIEALADDLNVKQENFNSIFFSQKVQKLNTMEIN
jgi:hypothetical protein